MLHQELFVCMFRAHPRLVVYYCVEYGAAAWFQISKDGEEKCLAVFYCDMSQYVKEDGSK